MSKEQRFYKALEGVFTGVLIEGDSGFVNLLNIKEIYYREILQLFKDDIAKERLLENDGFKEEFFNALYSFFSKYFSNNGSVFFNKTTNWDKVYEKIYGENDVVLFWKTNMLYYVKSDILFQSADITIPKDDTIHKDYHFHFDATHLKQKQNNEKKALIFEFNKIVTDEETDKKTLHFKVDYANNGSKTHIDEIRKHTNTPEEVLEKAFASFKKQGEVDFFINKHAQKFLTEQLDFYLHELLLTEENKFEQHRLEQIKIIKTYAKKIIHFIAQFEDELVRLWNKPKFARNAHYVITIDKLPDTILHKISQHKGIQAQIKEWQKMDMVDTNFRFEDIVTNGLWKERSPQYYHLPIDTKYFKNLETEILHVFEHIDDALDGRLIYSENYQALNTLQEKYRGKVQCIYIDPPFNLGSNADFHYNVNYKDASWATLLENRIRLAHTLLSDAGSIFVRCDYNGNYIARMLLDKIFGTENFRNEIIVKRTRTLKGEHKKFSTSQDTLFLFSKNLIDFIFYGFRTKKPKEEWEWVDMHLPGSRKDKELLYRNFFGQTIKAPEGRRWTLSQSALENAISQNLVKIDEKSGMPKFLTKYYTLGTDWLDISGYSKEWNFTTENSEILLQRVIQTASQKEDVILDFFTGSATTIATAHKLGRKWMGVEMGHHFHTVAVPRMKAVVFGKLSGISREIEKENKLTKGGFFKYYDLEQYEETLKNTRHKNQPYTMIDSKKSVFEQYVFHFDSGFEQVIKELKNGEIKITFDHLYQNIDFAETISNITGLPIKRIYDTSVVLQDGDEEREICWDFNNMDADEQCEFLGIIQPLIWWGK